jgi:hypothetical protein
MGRRYYLKFEDGQEIEFDNKLWPVGSHIPLKDSLAYERQFNESPAVFLEPFDDFLKVPTSFWLFFVWRELQRQEPALAGRDYVAFCERLTDFRDLTTYPGTDEPAEEGEGTPDPPGARLRAS